MRSCIEFTVNEVMRILLERDAKGRNISYHETEFDLQPGKDANEAKVRISWSEKGRP